VSGLPSTPLELNILIASPSDTQVERREIKKIIKQWNDIHSSFRNVRLRSLTWESDSIPLINNQHGQTTLNGQIVDPADILIAVFASRLGQPTPTHASGSAEEIDRCVQRGIPVHVYTSRMPHANNVNTRQLDALRDYVDTLMPNLLGSYRSIRDLRTKVQKALERDIHEALRNHSP
jgi:hypothetical protein